MFRLTAIISPKPKPRQLPSIAKNLNVNPGQVGVTGAEVFFVFFPCAFSILIFFLKQTRRKSEPAHGGWPSIPFEKPRPPGFSLSVRPAMLRDQLDTADR